MYLIFFFKLQLEVGEVLKIRPESDLRRRKHYRLDSKTIFPDVSLIIIIFITTIKTNKKLEWV